MKNSDRSVDVSERESIRSDSTVAMPVSPAGHSYASAASGSTPLTTLGTRRKVLALEAAISRVQKLAVVALSVMLVVVMLLSTIHLGVLIGEEIWKPPRWLIPVQGLLEIFGYFLLVLIGVELLETLKAYLKKDVIHVRVVLEVALMAMARKVIIQEPNAVSGATSFGIAGLILALAIAFYFERQAKRDPVHG
jgi:uncharacterized membrane protein (DUF373 family)